MKEKQKKILLFWLGTAGILCLFGSVFLFLKVGESTLASYQKIFGVISAILMLVLVFLVGIYLFLSRDVEPNYFLFDRKKRKNLSTEELTFARINERMTFLICQICENKEDLWKSDALFHEDDLFGYRSVYKPLVAYKMLYDLGIQPKDSDAWELLMSANRDLLTALTEAMERAGDKQFSEAFYKIFAGGREESDRMKEFISRNLAYFRGKMTDYVKKYIELFY